MSGGGGEDRGSAAAGARALLHHKQAIVCDTLTPWSHGTLLRASRYPTYYAYNLVRVERGPGLGATALMALADRALAGMEHRRIDCEDAAAAAGMRADFDAAGWISDAILWLRHEGPLPAAGATTVQTIPYDQAEALRVRWEREDHPDLDPGGHLADRREVAIAHGAQVLAVLDGSRPVGFVDIEWTDARAEVAGVYVAPEHRGRGLGTALTSAALAEAAGADAIWIQADAEDAPRRIYERLGFRPAWALMQFTRWPQPSSPAPR